MQYQTLGYSDLKVSRLCMGNMNFATQVDEATGAAISQYLDAAVDVGYTFIDTAEMYSVPASAENQGKPEEWLGTWMKGRQRDKLVIATKVTGPNQMGWIPERRIPPGPKGGSGVRTCEYQGGG